MKKTLISYAIIAAAGFAVGHFSFKAEKEIEYVEVVKEVSRERSRTVIKEQPDGSKTTIIESVKDTVKDLNKSYKSVERSLPKYSVWASAGLSRDFKGNPIYTLGVDKRIALGLSVGLYGRTDKESGVSLRYEF